MFIYDLRNGLIYCQYRVTPAVIVFISVIYLILFTVSIKSLDVLNPQRNMISSFDIKIMTIKL